MVTGAFPGPKGRVGHPDPTQNIGQNQAQQELEPQRLARATPIPRDRQARLTMARDRLLEDWQLVHRVEAEHAAWRAHGVSRDGARRMGRSTKPVTLSTDAPSGSANTTDPRLAHTEVCAATCRATTPRPSPPPSIS
jgi:hypothetical protein